jgi:hypothetical protein
MTTLLSADPPPSTTIPIFPSANTPHLAQNTVNSVWTLIQNLEWVALILALIGILVGAAVWALGSHSQNFHQSVSGRKAVLVSGLAALVIGAGPALITFCFNAGRTSSK